VQNKAAKCANHSNDSVWETLVQRRKIARICALFSVCVTLKEGKRSMSEKKEGGEKNQNAWWQQRNSHDTKLRVVDVLQQPQGVLAYETMP
jgi:hypothetical protein